ncbi:MAG: leucine-rich repeat protein [Bacteroidales bacterium]
MSIALLIIRGVTAQPDQPCESCLPQGITFKNQHQVDLFQTTYPNCTEIEGSVTISGNGILNLYGLSVLTSIGGNLQIRGNSYLTGLTGLNNLTSVEGSLEIGSASLGWNQSLISLTGLENLTSIGGHFEIVNNNALTSLMGIENLTTIGGYLSVYFNSSLSACDAEWLCDYLAAPAGPVNIHSNANGCNSVIEVADACGDIPCLPYGNYYFSTQSDVDSFQVVFPSCTELQGNVIINGIDITDLSGLENVTSIGGNLSIDYNISLTTLTGLENLTIIGGTLSIRTNNSLTSLTGLENLTSIGGDLWIRYNNSITTMMGLENIASIGGGLIVHGNDSLTCLTGLENLTVIGDDLQIGSYYGSSGNPALTCLTGLDNLTFIGGNLSIGSNSSLTSLTGLENLTSIEGSFWIGANSSLTSLTGLENLTSIGDFFTLYNNNALTNLEGLDNLASIGGYFVIQSNSAMTGLEGLENLISIGDYLEIWANGALTSLTGLENLTAIGSHLSVYSNSSLVTCNEQWLCDYLAAPTGAVNIRNNATGCMSVIDVAYECGGMPCLPNGNYYFSSQSDIDNFQSAFPDCTELQGIVYISGNNITDLSGLDIIYSIGGSLSIYNSALNSLTGLDNLTSVVSHIRIRDNISLTSLTGLENLTSIGSYLEIRSNSALTSLTGLGNLTSIGSYLEIWFNNALTGLSGLDNLISIGDYLDIYGNYSLTSLTGLENLTSIGDYLTIFTNNSLASLNGLDNLTAIGGELRITNNNSLSTCNAQWLCDYLVAPAGVVEIYQNAAGCETVMEVASACGGLPCLPYGNYRFYSQTDIDIFQAAFSNCSELQGDVIISGVDISGLSGLDMVNSIGGLLYITKTSLTSLNGMENLTAIGGMLQLGCWIEISGNSSLTSLKGLDSLTSIGGSLGIYYNNNLNSLTGLESLTSIGGDIGVSNNSSLTSLSGIDNIDAGSITILYIHDNTSLSTCHVQSICEYLIMPNGWTQISGNATGCNSFEQVLSACMVGVDESSAYSRQPVVNIYPNPASSAITIELPHYTTNKNTSMTIYNISGQPLISRQLTEQQTIMDLSGLVSGVYIIRMVDEKGVMVGKLVKR